MRPRPGLCPNCGRLSAIVRSAARAATTGRISPALSAAEAAGALHDAEGPAQSRSIAAVRVRRDGSIQLLRRSMPWSRKLPVGFWRS